jgi:hypothetical protein
VPRADEVEEINNCDDVQEAIGAYEATGETNKNEERYIINRAVALGCTEHIPDDWGL